MITYHNSWLISKKEVSTIVKDLKQNLVVPTLSEEVYKHLRDKLIKGEFSPGEKISIRKIADMYGVSTMPAREALKRLQSEGFITAERRSTVVKRLSSKELIEIFMLRKTLEKMAIEWAFSNIGKIELASLENTVKEMDQKADPLEWNNLNKQFHFKLYSYSYSAPLLELLETTWGRVEPYMNIYASSSHHIEVSQQEHYKMLELLAKMDLDGLIQLTMDHIQKTCDVILDDFKR